jgi:hypothetical protein
MLAASFLQITREVKYNFASIKVVRLAACIAQRRWICHFPPVLAYNLHSPPANGKQGPIPEEMSKTLLTNKK